MRYIDTSKYKPYIAVLFLGILIGWVLHKPQVVTKVEYKERQVASIVTKEREVIKRKVKPDGTIIENIERDVASDVKTSKEIDMKREESRPDNRWSVGLYATNKHALIGTVDRRILGDIFVGGSVRVDANLNPEIGVGIRIEF